MIELYQAEWCPDSHRVRQRLTELGLTFVARQVAADPSRRDAMRAATGKVEIPVLLVDQSQTIAGSADEIIAELNRRFEERDDAAEHRQKAGETV
jgi:glutaredoxin